MPWREDLRSHVSVASCMAGRFGRLDRKALKVLANEQFLIIYTRSRSDAGLGQLRVAPEAFFATFVARSPTERGKSSPLTGFVGGRGTAPDAWLQ